MLYVVAFFLQFNKLQVVKILTNKIKLMEFIMNNICSTHPDKNALSFCHNCGKYYCSDCLNEGNEYYYCNAKDCLEKFKEEINTKTENEIKIYASFWHRFDAYIIDAIILFIVNTIIFIPLYLANIIHINPNDIVLATDWVIIFRHPYTLLTALFYFSFMESSQKLGTFGKQKEKIIVVTKKGDKISLVRAVARNLLKLLTLFTIVGNLLPVFLKKNRHFTI